MNLNLEPVHIPFRRHPVPAAHVFAAVAIVSPIITVTVIVYIWGRTDNAAFGYVLATNAALALATLYGLAKYDRRRRNP